MSLAVKTLQDLSDDPAKRRIAEDRERDLLAHGHNMAVARRVGRQLLDEEVPIMSLAVKTLQERLSRAHVASRSGVDSTRSM